MTASRGAWLGLAAVGAACLLWAVTRRRSAGGLGWSRRTWGVLGGIALAGMAGMAALAWVWGPVLAPGGRIDLLRNSIDLALDTPFTGIGLGKGVFMMAYSTYVLVLHVGQTIHSHVLPLNIWLEQGLLGLAAFAWLLVAAVRARYVSPAWRAAGLASLGVILLHGLVDDSLYGSRGVVLLFVPLAILAREDLRFALEYGSLPRAVRGPAAALGRGAAPTRAGAFSRVAAVGLALVVTLLLIAALLPPVRAAFQADLGALAQTRAELSVYRWPDWPVQDALRRSPQVDLAPAIARYRAALALDPANVTANRRLGQIEMSRGDYAAALAHLQRAYAAAPDQRATRQLLGEAYAVTGDTARAAELWATVDLSAGQLPGRAWWYDHVGEKAIAGRIQEAGG
jgi:tetratricopeptide (TPR) repeat protein